MVTLVRAPNPSAMTLSGTNSYIVSHEDDAVVIDPGPDIPRHIDAIVERARALNVTIRAIALTHGHPDHAPGAAPLAAAVGAPIYAHPRLGSRTRRRSAARRSLPAGSVALRVIDAPGHTFDHVVFYEPHERALFTGDVILGEGTVVIAPPGGAMRPYQRTLRRLADEFGDARVHLRRTRRPRRRRAKQDRRIHRPSSDARTRTARSALGRPANDSRTRSAHLRRVASDPMACDGAADAGVSSGARRGRPRGVRRRSRRRWTRRKWRS